MTVTDLIEALQELLETSPELANETVFASYCYGDHGRTEALVRVQSVVHAHVAETCYSPTQLRVMSQHETAGIEEGAEIPPREVVLGMYPDDNY